MAVLEVLAFGDADELFRPCADCGLRTGSFCDFCYGADRYPKEKWAANQHTPLCSRCDDEHGACHFCREEQSSSDSDSLPAPDTHTSDDVAPVSGDIRTRPALQPGDLDPLGRVVFGPIAPPGLIELLEAEEQEIR